MFPLSWLGSLRNCPLMRVNHWPLLWQACYFIVAIAKSVSSLTKEIQEEDVCQMTSGLSGTKGCVDLCQYTDHTHLRGWGWGCHLKKKGMTEAEMVGWHHKLNGHEFEQVPRDGEGQGSLACCSPWGHSESDTTEWLNNNNNLPYQA